MQLQIKEGKMMFLPQNEMLWVLSHSGTHGIEFEMQSEEADASLCTEISKGKESQCQ